ncbi:hypothetical protein ABGB16_18000 [Micromonospora sp. B11E3]|uniref:hypothetical protein n=1 Tax=Micromonospora sp. B11E3 TaxID=3153562 RepID=UPI00325C4504
MSAFAASGGMVSLLAMSGWPAVVLLLVAAAMTAALVGWVVNDRERAERLATLVHAFRQNPAAARARRSRPPS